MSPAAQAMLEKVRTYRHVSMVELTRVFDEICGEGTSEGDQQITLAPPHENLVLWACVSVEFCDAFDEIRPFATLDPAHWLVYLHDGAALRLPLAKRPPKAGYKKPHWVPVVLNPNGREPAA